MNKEVKTTKKNKSTINKNNLDLDKEIEKEFTLLVNNNNDIKKINRSKSIKIIENNDDELNNNNEKKESKSNLIDMKEKKIIIWGNFLQLMKLYKRNYMILF